MYPYFIAGLFDGDGYVGIVNKKFICSLISTKEVLDKIQDILKKEANIKHMKYYKVSENCENVWKIVWYKDAYNFINYIYNADKNIYLSRKYKIYDDYKKRYITPAQAQLRLF